MSPVLGVAIVILSIIASIVLAVLFLPTKKREQLTGVSAWLHDLFNFRTLAIEKILKYLYILSTCICIIGGLLMMGTSVFARYNGGQQFLTGLLTLVFGPIAVRLSYELVMMFVLLVTNVLEINKKMKEQPSAPMAAAPAPVYQPPVPPRYMFCTQCGTKYDANRGNCPNCGKQ